MFIPDALSTSDVASQITAALAGYLSFEGVIDASSNPNYPAASKGDTYKISVAGKVGGASGTTVDVGDMVTASADNAGGTQASVGSSWFITQANLVAALLSANNLSDIASAATARANLALDKYIAPVCTARLVGNVTVSQLNALTGMIDGDAYVVTDSGTATPITAADTLAAGDVVEYSDTGGVASGNWQFLARGSGGYVPSGTRAIISKGATYGSTSPASPYASDGGKVVQFDGTSNTGTVQSEAVIGAVAALSIPAVAAGWYTNSYSSRLGTTFVCISAREWVEHRPSLVRNVTASSFADQATAPTLQGVVNLVTVGGNLRSVRLPSGPRFGASTTAGTVLPLFVVNTSTTNTLAVFPASGGKINQGSADASVSLLPNTVGVFVSNQIAANDWTFASLPNVDATTGSISVVFDGGGSALTVDSKLDVSVPVNCKITGARLLADQSGSVVINIWKDTYANYPPTVDDKITASAPPTISSATKSNDTTLTGWTTQITAGDTLRFNVDSCTTITRVTLTLTIRAN